MSENSTINFQSTAPTGSTRTLAYRFSRAGRITRLYVEAVPGEQADVLRRWFLKTEEASRRNLVVQATAGSADSENYLAGDDTKFDLRVDQEFSTDDVLQLEIENTDGSNSYPNIGFAEVTFNDGVGSELIPLLRRWT